ncbi:MAG: putative dehydrogenase/threonine dehydrogenase-like Zn-dependent dehydrogenase [Bacteroidia bacterium]|jgi:predicted dehydrogenase/threonine dehydrogenase-like Zn-dependent dehydrogenase
MLILCFPLKKIKPIVLQAVVKKGKVIADRVPTPNVSEGSLLIKVVNSCISAGTEMSNVSETGKSLIKRALDQPAEVRNALNFAKENGIMKMIARVRGTLEGGKPTGYSIAGIVIAVGKGVKEYSVGDHVAAAGAGIANHAEYVDVPVNLVMPMPNGMDFKLASTVTLGGIAMQGVRRAELHFGEICVVQGAGILGLLAQQMLQAAGIRTIVIDLDEHRLKIANELGAEAIINPTKEDIVKKVEAISNGYGADAVLFTAATSSSAPLSDSFKMCKRKGKVVLVGVSGMEIKRGDIYQKELDFLISTSYGPGRYDDNYEKKGLDYPYGYVRWTENRNMSEYLRMVHTGTIKLDKMVDAVYSIDQVEEAFDVLKNGSEPKPIISILDYGVDFNLPIALPKEHRVDLNKSNVNAKQIQVALIGTGGFATGMHLPNMAKLSSKFKIKAIVNRTGQKAKAVADQYGADYSTSEIDDVLNDQDIELIMITTRHDNHGELVLRGLNAGKHVFVEKPLCINRVELQAIKDFYAKTESPPMLMVGFNRRFSPAAKEIKKHVSNRTNPLVVHYRMNAGYIPLSHWTHESGGRIVGEACHLIDLMTHLTGSKISSISTEHLTPKTDKFSKHDNRSIILKYEDGSVCHVQYFAVGSKKLAKEFMEVHFDEKSIIMEDYKRLKGYGVSVKDVSSSISNKGQFEELKALHICIKEDGTWPIPLWDMIQTTLTSFEVEEID